VAPRDLLRAALAACLWLLAGPASAQIELPDGPGRDLVYGQCRTCHDLQYLVDSAGIPARAWNDVVIGMREYGLRVPDDVRAGIVDYLGTYLGPNPPKAAAVAAPGPPADGKKIFMTQCIACHRGNGKGLAGRFPPLAGNSDLFVDRTFPIYVVLHGLRGPIEVGGKRYNGVMPSFAHLSDGAIAAVIAHVRSAWGNESLRPDGFEDVVVDDVAAARTEAMDSKAVHALRARLE